MQDFHELKVRQKAHEVTLAVYRLTGLKAEGCQLLKRGPKLCPHRAPNAIAPSTKTRSAARRSGTRGGARAVSSSPPASPSLTASALCAAASWRSEEHT